MRFKVGLQSMRGSDAFLLRSSPSLRSGWLLLRLLCWIILAVPTLLTRQTLRSHLKSHKVTCWTDSSGGRSGGHCFCILFVYKEASRRAIQASIPIRYLSCLALSELTAFYKGVFSGSLREVQANEYVLIDV